MRRYFFGGGESRRSSPSPQALFGLGVLLQVSYSRGLYQRRFSRHLFGRAGCIAPTYLPRLLAVNSFTRADKSLRVVS